MLILLMGIGVGGLAVQRGWLELNPNYNPWAPIDLTAAPNLLTRFKMHRLGEDYEECIRALETTDIIYQKLADRPVGMCPLTGTVQVKTAGVTFNRSFMATCQLAAGWEVFRHHTLQHVARRHFGQDVVEVEHLGSYACRNVYNRKSGRLSEHASANALDIAAFVLADGMRISVERDWNNTRQPRKMAFLREVHDGACRAFHVVLGPDYNAAHRNHFHFDMGGFGICR